MSPNRLRLRVQGDCAAASRTIYRPGLLEADMLRPVPVVRLVQRMSRQEHLSHQSTASVGDLNVHVRRADHAADVYTPGTNITTRRPPSPSVIRCVYLRSPASIALSKPGRGGCAGAGQVHYY